MSTTMQAYPRHQYGDRTYNSLESILDDPSQLFMTSSAAAALDRPVGGDLDILSASRYPQGLMQPYDEPVPNTRKRKSALSEQLYGGVVYSAGLSDSNPSSSAEQEQPPTQKKKKTAKRASVNDADDQGDSKKQRGRPRLDTQDETAADRRRTQIRLAQRAYRHRKETTISALKGKVLDLQNTIEQMNRTFLTLHDNMVDAGILASHYSLGRQLQAATEEFILLSKIASPESDDEEEQKIAKMTKGEFEPSPTETAMNSRGSGARDRETSSRTKKSAKVGQGNSFDQSPTDADADVEEVPLTKPNHDDNENTLVSFSQFSFMDNANLHSLDDVLSFSATLPDTFTFDELSSKVAIERPLKPAYHQGSYTYSFQETTFARRLHRMCLERAFRNLTNANIDQEYISRTFRFTFCFSNRKRMLQRFQEMLKRRAGESLENWNVPFFHIGGAGTHFPRRDDEGNAIYPPNMISPAKAFGPQPWIPAETPRVEKTTQEMLDNIGFGGEWYDSHDVEQYLRTKGIFLDGQSSFVEVDPTVFSLIKASTGAPSAHSAGTLSNASSNSPDRSPHEPSLRTPSPLLAIVGDPLTDPFLARELGDMYGQPSTLFPSFSTTSTDQLPQSTSTAFQDKQSVPDTWAEFTGRDSPAFAPMFPDLLGRSQAPAMFDVELFLERMVQASACLGRAPGFRKAAIDDAMLLSLQESY